MLPPGVTLPHATLAAPQRLPGAAYGLAGLPLAFAALPLYVQLPAHYASELGLSLATVGAILLGVRAFDALADPLIGRWIDARLMGRPRALRRVLIAAALLLLAGFVALFFPAPGWRDAARLVAWCAASLVVASVAHSVITVIHQAWGAQIARGDAAQARLVAWREGCALAGVVTASVLPSLAGFGVTAAFLAGALGLGVAGLLVCPSPPTRPAGRPAHATRPGAVFAPWRQPHFARLLAIFMVNGTASAVPATLVLFFVRDRLHAGGQEAGFLAAYFVSAALSLPLWVRTMACIGLARGWQIGMWLSIASFAGTFALGPGDATWFYAICLCSGAALGADLVAPPALLAAVVRGGSTPATPPGAEPSIAGAGFGWWNLATKLNLALAAGLGLPLLAAAGYAPGRLDDAAQLALRLGYAVLPCLLKAVALLMLGRLWIHGRAVA